MSSDATNSRHFDRIAMNQSESTSGLPQPVGRVAFRLLVLALLFGVAAIWDCVTMRSLEGNEIWGHLRVGSWILEQHRVPHTGLFSQVNLQTWRDFRWGYDALAALLERILGIRAVPALTAVFRVVLAVLAFLLAGGRRDRFWIAVAASVSAQLAFSTIYVGPANCSLLLFGITLLMLFSRASERTVADCSRIARNSPNLGKCEFRVHIWHRSNWHVFHGESDREKWGRGAHNEWVEAKRERMPFGVVSKIILGCLLASLCNPYGYYPYESFTQNCSSRLNSLLPGYGSMSFHRPQDYLILLLTTGAALSLGLRRSRDLFLMLLLVACAFVSFHSEKESWLVGLAALAVIGSAGHTNKDIDSSNPPMKSVRIIPAAAATSFYLRR